MPPKIETDLSDSETRATTPLTTVKSLTLKGKSKNQTMSSDDEKDHLIEGSSDSNYSSNNSDYDSPMSDNSSHSVERRRKHGKRRQGRRKKLNESDSDVLSLFRRLLRERISNCSSSASNKIDFPSALYHNFQEIHHKSKDGIIHRSDFAEQLRVVLNNTSTRVSDKDVDNFMAELDADGNGTIEWDEFVSFMSYTESEMREIIHKLRRAIRTEMDDKKFDTKGIYQKLLLESNDKSSLSERSLGQYFHNTFKFKLTPGETREIFQFIDSDGDGQITQDEFTHFLSETTGDLFKVKNGDFDDSAPIVDIQITTDSTKQTEENLRTSLGFKQLPGDANGYSSFAKSIRLWVKKEKQEDSSSPEEFQKKRITDICLSPHKVDSVLVAQGFICLKHSLNEGLFGGKDLYLWVRRNSKDEFPILNIAVTTGKAKDPKDPVHFPPFHGYKRCPGHVNLGGFFSKDVFLWYRKASYMKEKTAKTVDIAKERLDEMVVERVRSVLRDHCIHSGAQPDLEKSFKRYDRSKNGYISRSEFKIVLEDEGLFLEKKELTTLMNVIDSDSNNKISMKEFFNFIQRGEKELDGMAMKVRRKVRGFSRRSKNGIDVIFSKYDKSNTGSLNMFEFKNFLREMKIVLSDTEMKKFIARFDPDELGRVERWAFVNFVHGATAKYDKAILEKVFEEIKDILSGVATKKKRPNWQLAFDHIAFLGGDQFDDGSCTEISREVMDKAFEKILENSASRDQIGDEEIIYLIDHFDFEKEGTISVDVFKDAIMEKFTAPKRMSRKNYHPVKPSKNKKAQSIKRLLAKLCDQVEAHMKNKGKKYSVEKAFQFFDVDGNKYLERQDFEDSLGVLKLSKNLSRTEIDDLLDYFDVDGDGKVDYKEFHRALKSRGKGLLSENSDPEVESSYSRGRATSSRRLRKKKKSSYDEFSSDEESSDSLGGYSRRQKYKRQVKRSRSYVFDGTSGVESSTDDDNALFEQPRREDSGKRTSGPIKTIRSAMRRSQKRCGRSAYDLHKVFKKFARKTGPQKKNCISIKGFTRVLQDVDISISSDDLRQVVDQFRSGKQAINYHKFLVEISDDYAGQFGDEVDEDSSRFDIPVSEVKKKLRRMINVSRDAGIDVRKMFEVFDKNGDNVISSKELRSAAGGLGLRLSMAETQALVKHLDRGNRGDGTVDYNDILEFAEDNKKELSFDHIESKIKKTIHTFTTGKFGNEKKSVSMEDEFALFDLDGTGFVTPIQFQKGLKKLGILLSKSEMTALLDRLDKNDNGRIDYEEFVRRFQYGKEDLEILARKLRKRFLERAVEGHSFQETFRNMDRNGDGFINRKEFRDALNSLNVSLTERELRALMDHFDSEKRGKITYHAFFKFASPKDSDLSDLEHRMRERVRELAKVRGGIHTVNMVEPFEKEDSKHKGKITKRDFQRALKNLGLDVDEKEFRLLCARFDTNGDDFIDYKAFCAFANLDDRETSALAVRLRKNLRDAANDGLFLRDIFAQYDEFNSKGRVAKHNFREGIKKLRLGLSSPERRLVEDRFKAIDDHDDIMYLNFLKWINAATSSTDGWHDGTNDGGAIDLLATTGQDDEVWNSRTVRTWLNTSASPRQRRHFNRMYASLSSFKQTSRRGGHRFPKPNHSGYDSTLGSSLAPPQSPYRSPRRASDVDLMGTSTRYRNGELSVTPSRNRIMGMSWTGGLAAGPMSRLQLSAVETGDITEQEFRDNRQFFQQSGSWACPVCMFPNNKDFSRKCDMCASANPYMLPIGAAGSPLKFSFGVDHVTRHNNGNIDDALNGTVTWRGDNSEDDTASDSDQSRRKRVARKKRETLTKDYSSSVGSSDEERTPPRRRKAKTSKYNDDILSPRSQSDRRRRGGD
jgi:calcium-binding protein CML